MALLSERNHRELQEIFSELAEPVKIVVFTQGEGLDPGPVLECDYCQETRQLAEEVAAASDRIDVEVYDLIADADVAERYGIDQIPATVLVGSHGKDSGLRFYGIPAGYELAAIVTALVQLSQGRTKLAPSTIQALSGLQRNVEIQVFVTPTCPYCPRAVALAYQMAIASDWVTAEVIEANEFPELADRHNVMGVPKSVLNETVELEGAVSEQHLLRAVFEASEGVSLSEFMMGSSGAAP